MDGIGKSSGWSEDAVTDTRGLSSSGTTGIGKSSRPPRDDDEDNGTGSSTDSSAGIAGIGKRAAPGDEVGDKGNADVVALSCDGGGGGGGLLGAWVASWASATVATNANVGRNSRIGVFIRLSPGMRANLLPEPKLRAVAEELGCMPRVSCGGGYERSEGEGYPVHKVSIRLLTFSALVPFT
jgi:hypothetical protein